ncbi:hypothetical protein [Beduini massiliensis]|uniref:hypothetical protein n=1 Tax=Beduini massiliensis TaxID=1585974 RepID=UPI00059A9297|nr:hypothetical protein [Beduini massiliensis]
MDPIISTIEKEKNKFALLTKIIESRTNSITKRIVYQFFKDEGLSEEALNCTIRRYYLYKNNKRALCVKEIDTLQRKLTLSQKEIENLNFKNQLIIELWKNGIPIQLLDSILQLEKLNNVKDI